MNEYKTSISTKTKIQLFVFSLLTILFAVYLLNLDSYLEIKKFAKLDKLAPDLYEFFDLLITFIIPVFILSFGALCLDILIKIMFSKSHKDTSWSVDNEFFIFTHIFTGKKYKIPLINIRKIESSEHLIVIKLDYGERIEIPKKISDSNNQLLNELFSRWEIAKSNSNICEVYYENVEADQKTILILAKLLKSTTQEVSNTIKSGKLTIRKGISKSQSEKLILGLKKYNIDAQVTSSELSESEIKKITKSLKHFFIPTLTFLVVFEYMPGASMVWAFLSFVILKNMGIEIKERAKIIGIAWLVDMLSIGYMYSESEPSIFAFLGLTWVLSLLLAFQYEKELRYKIEFKSVYIFLFTVIYINYKINQLTLYGPLTQKSEFQQDSVNADPAFE